MVMFVATCFQWASFQKPVDTQFVEINYVNIVLLCSLRSLFISVTKMLKVKMCYDRFQICLKHWFSTFLSVNWPSLIHGKC